MMYLSFWVLMLRSPDLQSNFVPCLTGLSGYVALFYWNVILQSQSWCWSQAQQAHLVTGWLL